MLKPEQIVSKLIEPVEGGIPGRRVSTSVPIVYEVWLEKDSRNEAEVAEVERDSKREVWGLLYGDLAVELSHLRRVVMKAMASTYVPTPLLSQFHKLDQMVADPFAQPIVPVPAPPDLFKPQNPG